MKGPRSQSQAHSPAAFHHSSDSGSLGLRDETAAKVLLDRAHKHANANKEKLQQMSSNPFSSAVLAASSAPVPMPRQLANAAAPADSPPPARLSPSSLATFTPQGSSTQHSRGEIFPAPEPPTLVSPSSQSLAELTSLELSALQYSLPAELSAGSVCSCLESGVALGAHLGLRIDTVSSRDASFIVRILGPCCSLKSL